MRFLLFLAILTVGFCESWAQDSAEKSFDAGTLPTLYLADYKLRDFSVGQTLQELPDSLLLKNPANLTAVLQYYTPVYFKENGLGMVSSASFRGTTASQTAVLWNGININSSFLGQTDFNTVNTGAYDQISLRAGGGSLAYGTGAIGGTVHLHTELGFDEGVSNRLYLGYGSFNTLDTRYRLKASSEKWSFRMALSHSNSENDYRFPSREGKNINGEFRNTDVNLGVGYRFNRTNFLRFYSEYYDGNRHFPIFYSSEIRTRYLDKNWRNLLEWESHFGNFTSRLKTAFLRERYQYFENIEKEDFSQGVAKNYLAKYALNYKPVEKILLDFGLEHEHTEGEGSNVAKDKRDVTAASVLMKHQFTEKIKYQAGIRKEFTDSYGSPFLYSMGIEYRTSPFYQIKLSASKNYRRPTFNDLYWQGSGNPDLDAEKADQIELGNTFSYRNLRLNLTGYYNDIRDMIHWLPGSNGLFYPRNEDHIASYGLETLLKWENRLFDQDKLSLQGTYAYTVSEDQKTKKQLIYVPYHKATFMLLYSTEKFNADYQFLYNGSVYMHTDNNPNYVLGGYALSNVGLSYKPTKNENYEVGARVRNVFNKTYENVRRYEMPGINFNLFITITL